MMIEEHRPDRNCLFRRGDYSNKSHNPENGVVDSGEEILSVCWKLIAVDDSVKTNNLKMIKQLR
jgi:hypothetical protein